MDKGRIEASDMKGFESINLQAIAVPPTVGLAVGGLIAYRLQYTS